MKIRDHFTIDSTGLIVLSICFISVFAALGSIYLNTEGSNIKVAVLIFYVSAVILNRILPRPDGMARARLRKLRLATESLFAIGLAGLFVSWVFYGIWFSFFKLLMVPSFILAVYLLIKYGFKTKD